MPHIAELPQQLEAMRPALYRFAMLQLRNTVHAEDAVQETLLAVLEKPANFQGNSSLRTYVIGILKFKIIDFLRAGNREAQFTDFGAEDQSDEDIVERIA